jgi:hypothetical protein
MSSGKTGGWVSLRRAISTRTSSSGAGRQTAASASPSSPHGLQHKGPGSDKINLAYNIKHLAQRLNDSLTPPLQASSKGGRTVPPSRESSGMARLIQAQES